MRRLSMAMIAVLMVCAGCTDGAGEEHPDSAAPEEISFSSLGIDWPAAGSVDWAEPPATPEGFDDSLVERMADTLVSWAGVAATDEDVAHSAKALDLVVDALPDAIGSTLRAQVKGAVSPRLGVANVFAADVTIVGSPRITSAWKVSTPKDDDGKPYLLLQLQTRAAYEVRVGDGPTRVIGMLRVHGLSAYADRAAEFGVTGGWQEFGAADCALALDDELTPDGDADDARKDLATFVRIGSQDALEMPKLGVQDQVDAEYLKRCRAGAV